MFEIRQKVACVIDDWPEEPLTPVPFPLKRNQIVVVKAYYRAGQELDANKEASVDVISIGQENPEIAAYIKLMNLRAQESDYWIASWFRPLQKLDISEGLSQLIRLPLTVTPREHVEA